jgi:hypothetical protein
MPIIWRIAGTVLVSGGLTGLLLTWPVGQQTSPALGEAQLIERPSLAELSPPLDAIQRDGESVVILSSELEVAAEDETSAFDPAEALPGGEDATVDDEAFEDEWDSPADLGTDDEFQEDDEAIDFISPA